MLRYLRGTTNVGLKFERKSEGMSIPRLVDFDFSGDIDKRRSSTRYVFTILVVP